MMLCAAGGLDVLIYSLLFLYICVCPLFSSLGTYTEVKVPGHAENNVGAGKVSKARVDASASPPSPRLR